MIPLAFALVAFILAQESDPRSVVEQAHQALEAGGVSAMVERWEGVAPGDPTHSLAVLGLATLDRLLYDYPSAHRRFDLLLAPGRIPDDPLTLQAALGRGTAYLQAFRTVEAEAVLAGVVAAARELGESRTEVDARILLAGIAARSRGTVAALELLSEAEPLLPPGDEARTALLLCQRGMIQTQGGLPESMETIALGERAAERSGQLRALAGCRSARAQELNRQGRFREQIPLWDTIAELQRQSRNLTALSATRQWQGYGRLALGDFSGALANLEEAVATGELSGNRSAVAWTRLTLMELALRLDDPLTALEEGRAAAADLLAMGDRWGLLNLRGKEGDAAVLAHRPGEARTAYREALALAAAELPTIAPSLAYRLAALERREGKLEEAAAWLDRADSLSRTLRMTGWQTELAYERSLLALAGGRPHEAAGKLEELLARVPGASRSRFDVAARQAEALAEANRLDESEAVLAEAFRGLEEWRRGLDSRELRLAALHTRLLDWDPDLGIAGTLARLVEGGRVEAAFRLSEVNRARTLREALGRREALRPDGDGEGGGALHTPPRADGPAGGAFPAPPLGTALLSYVTGAGGEPTVAFVRTPTSLEARILPPADSLAPGIQRLVTLLEGGAGGEVLARQLAQELLHPLLPLIPGETVRLWVVPDGPLHRLPFDVLPLPDGEPLLERWTVSLAPSASLALTPGPRPPPPRGLLALGDPPSPLEGSPGWLPTPLPALPGAAREARRVARFAPGGRVLVGNQATGEALREADLSRVGTLHLAAHALVQDRSLLRTVLVLGDGATPGSGLLRPGELAALSLPGSLVVLSACRSGGGVLKAGEGVQGLTAPFLEAGAGAVVSTYWQVGDRSMVPLMEGFYRGMANGLGAAEALAEAKRQARRRGDPAAVWASVALTGDGELRPELRTPGALASLGGGGWGFAAYLLLLLTAGLLYGALRRRERSEERTSTPPGSSAVTHHR